MTTTLTETNGKTTLHMVVSFETKEMRDMVFATGMADGAGESYDKLEALLAARCPGARRAVRDARWPVDAAVSEEKHAR